MNQEQHNLILKLYQLMEQYRNLPWYSLFVNLKEQNDIVNNMSYTIIEIENIGIEYLVSETSRNIYQYCKTIVYYDKFGKFSI